MHQIKALLLTAIILAGFVTGSQAQDSWDNVMSMKDVDSKPVPVDQSPPSVPSELKGQSGIVHVGFIIDASGGVVETRVIKTTDERLNEIAVQTVSTWRFKAAENGGQATAVRAVVPIRFK